ncbi:hypothetical protein CEXT_250971 [Caerostris extrusa]|uniref:EGF-like domain-containing protein n=1 Tax=Caerostris extrusa TaxID=172846 RepID=A0AAV4PYL0_CAEEX|nr:hypothetical protein CEXT_250971 [Caerostris extrusa]
MYVASMQEDKDLSLLSVKSQRVASGWDSCVKRLASMLAKFFRLVSPEFLSPHCPLSIDMKTELCDQFCFPADMFLPTESDPMSENSPCSRNQVSIPICDEMTPSKMPLLYFCPLQNIFVFCSPNPCKNGGTCKSSEWPLLPHLVSCECPPGFEGEYCEDKSTQRCSIPLNKGKDCGPPENVGISMFKIKNVILCLPWLFRKC